MALMIRRGSRRRKEEIAQAKNHSGLLWVLPSLVLGPIATFLLVAVCGKLPDRL